MRTGFWLCCSIAALVLIANTGPASAAGRARLAIGPGAIAVSVRDARGHPVQGALVVVAGPAERDATTGIAGIATLMALPLGTYSVRVSHSAFAPLDRTVTLVPGNALPVISVHLDAATFADLAGPGSATVRLPEHNVDPILAHALVGIPGVAVVSGPGFAGSGISLAGQPAEFTAYELDGIPLAGNASALDALRFRNALALDSVDIAQGPTDAALSPQNAIGGVVDFRTPPLQQASAASAAFGYDSRFGSFQTVAISRGLGRLEIMADAAVGGGENRSQVLKAQYQLSGATSLGFAAYGSQSTGSAAVVDLANEAPATALDLRTRIGAGTLQARAYRSASTSVEAIGSFSHLIEADRIAGTQVEYDVPAGDNLLALEYDERFESGAIPYSYRNHYTTLGLRADVALSPLARLELGDAYVRGTAVAGNAPHAALAIRAAKRFRLTASAGSAFATGLPYARTSFGYRVGAEDALSRDARMAVDAFDLRDFYPLPGYGAASSRGADISFSHAPPPGSIGFSGSLGLVHSRLRGLPLAGIPNASALFGVDYRAIDGLELNVAEDFVGDNNSATRGSFALSNATARIPLGTLGAVRFDAFNIFGQPIRNVLLVPLYGRSFGLSLAHDGALP